MGLPLWLKIKTFQFWEYLYISLISSLTFQAVLSITMVSMTKPLVAPRELILTLLYPKLLATAAARMIVLTCTSTSPLETTFRYQGTHELLIFFCLVNLGLVLVGSILLLLIPLGFFQTKKKKIQERKFPIKIFWNIGAGNFEMRSSLLFLNSLDYGNLN